MTLNFPIIAEGPYSQLFLGAGAKDFTQACTYVQQLPYSRNSNKEDLRTLFSDACGTCSSKHGVLKYLIDENEIEGFVLTIGIYAMNAQNTPTVAKVLENAQLDYLPEAHCYLRYQGTILDFTKASFHPSLYQNDILLEQDISPTQIGRDKVSFHRRFLENWLTENPHIFYSLDELWSIREACIAALSD